MKRTISISVFTAVALAGLIAVGFVLSLLSSNAHAGPSYFLYKQTAAATSTLAFMSAGTATSTLTFDMGAGVKKGVDSVILLEQFNGSSTAAILNTDIQYSDDGINWFAESQGWNVDFSGTAATTSPALGNLMQYTFTFASSSINRQATDNAFASANRILNLVAPTRYIRAVFTMPSGSTNGAVWAEFISKIQAPQ